MQKIIIKVQQLQEAQTERLVPESGLGLGIRLRLELILTSTDEERLIIIAKHLNYIR